MNTCLVGYENSTNILIISNFIKPHLSVTVCFNYFILATTSTSNTNETSRPSQNRESAVSLPSYLSTNTEENSISNRSTLLRREPPPPYWVHHHHRRPHVPVFVAQEEAVSHVNATLFANVVTVENNDSTDSENEYRRDPNLLGECVKKKFEIIY